MDLKFEQAKVLYNLLRRKKIGKNYDRLEHLKRFDKKAIKELLKENLLISKGGKKFTPISVNPLKLEKAKKIVKNKLKILSIRKDKNI